MSIPWMSPHDTVEALEILEDVEELLRNTATFGSLRKPLRINLENEARAILEFRSRTKQGVIDTALLLAIEELALHKKTTAKAIIMDALESYISEVNRRSK